MFDRLRRAVALVLGNRSLLGQVTCPCFFRAFVPCSSSLLFLCSSLFLFQSWFVCGVLTMHSSRGRLRNGEYSILLVMSELSTVWCDRALGLWIAGTGSSSTRRHRGEDFDSKKESRPSNESMYLFRFCPYGPSSLISALGVI